MHSLVLVKGEWPSLHLWRQLADNEISLFWILMLFSEIPYKKGYVLRLIKSFASCNLWHWLEFHFQNFTPSLSAMFLFLISSATHQVLELFPRGKWSRKFLKFTSILTYEDLKYLPCQKTKYCDIKAGWCH